MRRQWLESLQKSTVRGVTFIFVPGYAGVDGNERADRLAGSAITTNGQPMDHADIINALREMGMIEDFGGSESTSLARMADLGIKIGTAKNETHTRHARRLVNQHRTGTISHRTLGFILRGGSEHLWTCPECNEDNPTN